MMKIVAHRGFWRTPKEKNRVVAFGLAMDHGFGIETDIRDYGGEIVISHDIPATPFTTLRDLLCLYFAKGMGGPLALNVKADGLQCLTKQLLSEYGIKDYFLFDMSVPDALLYLGVGMPAFTRQSDYETEPAFYKRAAGVWIDGFEEDWTDFEKVHVHLANGKRVCMVSPELHGRNQTEMWDRLRDEDLIDHSGMMICTDYPEEARRFFYG